MGLFSDINNHSQSGGGAWWKKGNYKIRIERVVFKHGFKGMSYIIESEVLESDNPEIEVGDKRSQVIKLEKTPAKGNIASFLRVCVATGTALDTGEVLDVEKIAIEESDVEKSFGPEQPCAGLELELYCYDTQTQTGGNFTVCQYKVPAELRGEEAAA